MKKGISLIVLVITIIVMIIIAGAIIISLSQTNVIDQATLATEKSDIAEAKSLVALSYATYLNKATDGWDERDASELAGKINTDLANNGFAGYFVSLNDDHVVTYKGKFTPNDTSDDAQ